MKTFRWIAIALIVGGAIVIGLWQIDGGQTSTLNRVVYVLIGLAVAISIIAIFNNDTHTSARTRRGSGDERGPHPGDGAVIHHSSGEADFDGFPGNVPPPIKDAEPDLPYSRKKSAD